MHGHHFNVAHPSGRRGLWTVIRVAAFLLPVSCFAQAPVIAAGGIVNGASFRPSGAPDSAVAAGSIISIFGQNLATSTAFALSLPLPLELGGTRVTIGGRPAPLFFVSAGQINAQVPWATTVGNSPVAVTNAAGVSAAVNVQVAEFGPGLFSVGANGRGPGAILNFVAEGNTPPNSFAAGIRPGGILLLFGTGFGAVTSAPADGAASGGQATVTRPVVSIGDRPATVEFSGLAPDFVGLYQINARVPADLPEGCFLPVRVSFGSVASNTVTVAVHGSGGSCAGSASGTIAPASGQNFGLALLGRFAIQSALPFPLPFPEPPDSFFASFLRATPATAGGITAALPPVNGGCIAEIVRVEPNLTIDVPALVRLSVPGQVLDAGTLTLTGPLAGSLRTVTAGAGGAYQLDFGKGGVQAGNYTLAGSGGRQVGAFSTVSLTLPSPLFAPGTWGAVLGTISRSNNLNVIWSCPEPEGTVTYALFSLNQTSGVAGSLLCSARCADGRITVPASALQLLPPSGTFTAGAALLLQPDPRRAPRLAATGLDAGYFTYLQAVAAVGFTVQ